VLAAEIRGLKEFRRQLKDVDAYWVKELRKASKDVADEGASHARREAASLGGVQAHAAKAIKGYATATEARVGILAGKRHPEANAAFWGAKRRTGWYGFNRYRVSRAIQHPVWVGNAWEPAVRGQGPYAINDALATHLESLLNRYRKSIDDLADLVDALRRTA